MNVDILKQAEKYYQLMGEKNLQEINKLLDPNVEFKSPLASIQGKDSVLKAISSFMNIINSLTIRAKFSSGIHSIVVYDVEIPSIRNEKLPSASLLTFKKGLISQVELFYDATSFNKG